MRVGMRFLITAAPLLYKVAVPLFRAVADRFFEPVRGGVTVKKQVVCSSRVTHGVQNRFHVVGL